MNIVAKNHGISKKIILNKNVIFLSQFFITKKKQLANNKKYTFYTLKKIYRVQIYNNLTISCNAV